MRNIKKLLLLVIFLAVAAVVLLFVLENQQPVALAFLGWSAPSLPVSVLVLAGLLLGMAVGPLLGWYVAMRSKRRFRRQLRTRAAEPLAAAPTTAAGTAPAVR